MNISKIVLVVLLGVAVGWYLSTNSNNNNGGEQKQSSDTKRQQNRQETQKPSSNKPKTPPAGSKPVSNVGPVGSLLSALEGMQVNVAALQLSHTDPAAAGSAAHLRFSNGIAAHAAADLEEFAAVLQLPASLQFNDRTADPEFSAGLREAAARTPDVLKLVVNPHMRLYSLVMNLVHEKYYRGEKSKWWWWLRTLPEVADVPHALFVSDAEYECLHVEGKQAVDTYRAQVELMYNVTQVLCDRPVTLEELTERFEASKGKGPGFVCAVTREQIEWAFAIASSRQIEVERMPSVIPVIDAMPYAIGAAVRPGALHRDAKGRHVTIDFIAARNVTKGEPLTFRTEVREAVDVLLLQGHHSDDHFAEGVQLWVQWDEKDAARLDELNCSTAAESTRMTGSGTWHDNLLRCAQLHVLQGGGGNGSSSPSTISRANYTFDIQEVVLGAFDFLLSQADLALGSIPGPESHPQCFDTPTLSRLGRQIALHNQQMRSMFVTFKDRLVAARALKKTIFDQINSVEKETAEKGTYEERLEAYDRKVREQHAGAADGEGGEQ